MVENAFKGRLCSTASGMSVSASEANTAPSAKDTANANTPGLIESASAMTPGNSPSLPTNSGGRGV